MTAAALAAFASVSETEVESEILRVLSADRGLKTEDVISRLLVQDRSLQRADVVSGVWRLVESKRVSVGGDWSIKLESRASRSSGRR